MVALIYAREGGEFRIPSSTDETPSDRTQSYWSLHLLLRTCSDVELVTPFDEESRTVWLQFGHLLRSIIPRLIGECPGLVLHDWEIPDLDDTEKTEWVLNATNMRPGYFIRMASGQFAHHPWPSQDWLSGQAAFGRRVTDGLIDTVLSDLEDGHLVRAREHWLSSMLEPKLRQQVFKTTEAVIGAYAMDWPESADPWYAFSKKISMEPSLRIVESMLKESGFQTHRSDKISALYCSE